MKLVVVGDPPVEITSFLARRRALDQDRLDEVWEGDYHVVPAPHPWHGQVLTRLARLLGPPADTYKETAARPLLAVSTGQLVTGIDWPGP